MITFLAFLAGLPSQFWSLLGRFVEGGATFLAGAEWQRLVQQAAENRKLNEQLQEIINIERDRRDVEKDISHMSDDDVIAELRRDYGPERRKNPRTGQ